MTPTLYFLTKTIGDLALFIFVLRFWLPLFRADFRNPISQSINKFTSPAVNTVRRFIPSIGRLDSATILVTFLLQYALIQLLLLIKQQSTNSTTILVSTFFNLCLTSADLCFFAIIIHIIFSWVAPISSSPIKNLSANIAEPLLKPYRKFFQPISGIDLSPIFAIIAIQAVIIFLRNTSPLLI